MLSLRISQIPEYLTQSAFYANLNAVDEADEVAVPQDCCKHDTSIADETDLEELLRTLRFWGMDRVPNSVLKYILQNPLEDWKHVLERFAGDLASVANIVQVIKCERNRQVCEAVEIGDGDIVSYLLEQSFPVSHVNQHHQNIRAVDIAAGKGNVQILKVLHHDYNCPFFIETATATALAGSKLCLEYIVEKGCPVVDNLVNYAFASGNLECLKYVHEIVGCKWTNNLFSVLESQDPLSYCDEQLRLQCLQYAQEHGCPSGPSAVRACVKHGLVLLLQNLHERGCEWDEHVVRMAVYRGQLKCVQYAIEHGCPYSEDLIWHSILRGHVELISYLRSRGLPWPTENLFSLRFINNEAAQRIASGLIHAYELGCPATADTCLFAAKFGLLDLLVHAHEHGCVWDEHCSRQAARWGHLHCLSYLHEHGCPWVPVMHSNTRNTTV